MERNPDAKVLLSVRDPERWYESTLRLPYERSGPPRMYSGFPDLRFTIEDLVAQGDKVVDRVSVRGTHQGEFMGMPPTGKRVESSSISLARIREGKIVERRGVPDMLGLMRQIGAVPDLGKQGRS